MGGGGESGGGSERYASRSERARDAALGTCRRAEGGGALSSPEVGSVESVEGTRGRGAEREEAETATGDTDRRDTEAPMEDTDR